MALSKKDEDTLRKALGGAYGGPSLSVEGDWEKEESVRADSLAQLRARVFGRLAEMLETV